MPNSPQKPVLNTRKRGMIIERAARHFLTNEGLKWIASNKNYRVGELDLIMQDNQTLVFIEVRYRKTKYFGTGAETIDYRKRRKIIYAAQCFLAENPLYSGYTCRFDIVQGHGDPPHLEWIQDAFCLDDI